MISQIRGVILQKELDRVEILTAGGVAYEVAIPLAVYEALPQAGGEATLHTHLVVRDDGWQLFGFSTVLEKRVFQRLLTASGVGPSLALGMISTLSAERVVRALRERDVATLQRAPRVGRKTAERIILDLAEKLQGFEFFVGTAKGLAPGTADALRALISLGYAPADAEKAVAAAIEAGTRAEDASEIIRAALALMSGRSP
ncbi:MAG TPA: Holliday junction branch migration protein RuvA [Gemmatimonadaceae bacterium]|nr:Holliday junction branch migration protein RuvA [Gemmatimonadaceae bacterium]